MGTGVPLTDDHSRSDITIEGMALPKPGSFPHPDIHIVSPAYVSALGIQLSRGRAFTDMDNSNGPRVALINAQVARQFFPGRDPIGSRFMFGHPSSKRAAEWITIVGVVGDTKMYGLENPARLEVYRPLRQRHWLHDAGGEIGERSRCVDVGDSRRGCFDRQGSTRIWRCDYATTGARFCLDEANYFHRTGIFQRFGAVLAAIGIYGVISYSVAQRTQEIGIRMALGAQPGHVLRMVIAQGGEDRGRGYPHRDRGLVRTYPLNVEAAVFRSPCDPVTFAAVTITLALIALLACYIPARRTLRVDPVSALRSE